LYTVANRLAEICGVEIDGIFVEDVALFNFAALPFARVVNAQSARIEPLDFATLARQIRTDAEQLGALFMEAVGNRLASARFSILQGNVCHEVLAQVRIGDLLVCAANESHFPSLVHLGQTASGLLRAAPCSIWIERGPKPVGGSVVGVIEGTPVPWHVVRQGAFWARVRKAPFVCVITGECPNAASVARQIVEFMAEAEIYGGRVIHGPAVSDVLAADADLLLFDAARFRGAPDRLRRWLAASSLPILLAAET
jgi:hypothetical protein